MAIGQKMNSLKALKQSLAKGGGNTWIKYIPKNGSMNVRFIEEPENWVNYVEHYDTVLRKSFPCNGEQGCPGCMGDARKSSRYLANVVNRDDSDRVIPLQMPKDLANRLVVRYERAGTLTNRDFELSRSGDGLDTTYDLDPGPEDRQNIAKYKPLDLMKVLTDAFNDVFGGGSDDDDEEIVAPTPSTKPRPIRRSKAAQVLQHDEDEQAEVEKPALAAAKAKKGKKKDKGKETPPEPHFVKDEPEQEPEDEGYTREELEGMPLGALRAVAKNEFGIEVKGLDEEEIIEAIFANGEQIEDDKPPF